MPRVEVTELLNRLNTLAGEEPTDEALSLMTDVRDTFDGLTPSGENWEERYKQNDAAWRDKYRKAFFSKPEEPDDSDEPDEPKKYTYENLFTTK